ncbi:phosphopantothenoylcysteine decarboxylase / phosphopantothenate---cysteine ligase [Nitratiruptor sp. YY08-26]|uniref:bifunctional phosphopantothenoylcysteine decarboxylase/phosphopantothenate--cysteine ligase CoaBC n=1 Tax=unclassified Nitratiruptor TaxID=2624044 RepID=UPI001914EAD6|nr:MULTISPECIES: bifunctional phosphopantothenoylcysteine decarboxylase/phosphopantothenate--cysteine ligase CoaBC [unclassified Nitratiruptor]BCD62016.1 phosphopantothenoylcysteine decarboxylase / phosphopantothenate---cysteine ligase [Nitratiruptor sp. YY08-13]BCD65952.1 phosphopantothenoylcysteine decarboxylase / phosphopantothenate---cysteine ligase [Nitratiruptor sp. YY08-26]
MLSNKKILLGVTGSISIYKAVELLRLFIKAGAEVKVVMTPSAKKFVSPLTFEAAGSQKVLCEESEDWTNRNNHIHVAQDYDIFVIAPATANTINKLSNGIADNLLTQTALAFDKIKILAPAMNTNMYKNRFTEASFKLLRLNGYKIVEPVSKELACGTTGLGALAPIEDIFYATARELLANSFWQDRYAIVTGGGTIERIDDVRFISNFSSGKQACALATALYLKGAHVELITTKPCENLPKGIELYEVESAQEMYEFLQERIKVAKRGIVKKPDLINDLTQPELIQKTPYLFMAAAVSDYRPKYPQRGKLKKEQIGEEWCLELVKNIDILSSIDKEGIKTVGFKAEMNEESALENAQAMLESKNIDAVCLNLVKGATKFGSDKNQIIYITKEKTIKSPLKEKLELALDITEIVKDLDE